MAKTVREAAGSWRAGAENPVHRNGGHATGSAVKCSLDRRVVPEIETIIAVVMGVSEQKLFFDAGLRADGPHKTLSSN